jgi:hypothetical protein
MIICWIGLLSILCIVSSFIDLITIDTDEDAIAIESNKHIEHTEEDISSLSSLEDSYDFNDVAILDEEL